MLFNIYTHINNNYNNLLKRLQIMCYEAVSIVSVKTS